MLLRHLLGNDIFISYSRSDGRAYAEKLYAQLRAMDYSCFIDYEKLYAGNQLNKALKRALLRSKVLLVVGTPGVRRPGSWVPKEVATFAETERPVIPINIRGALTEPRWEALKNKDGDEIIWVDDADGGSPSPAVFEEVRRLFRFNRRNVWVRAAITAVGVVLLAASAVAVWQASVAVANASEAEGQRKVAEEQRQVAEERTAALVKREELLTQREGELKQSNAALEERNRDLDRAQRELLAKTEEALANAERARAQEAAARANAALAEQRMRLAEERQRKIFSGQLAAQAQAEMSRDPELSLLLAAEADDVAETAETRKALRESLAGSHVRKVLHAGAPGLVASALSPDGRWAAAVGYHGAGHVWEVSTGRGHGFQTGMRRRTVPGVGFTPLVVAFVPGESFVVTDGRRVARFEVARAAAGHEQPAEQYEVEGPPPRGVAVSPDGRWAVSVGGTRARVWEPRTGRRVTDLELAPKAPAATEPAVRAYFAAAFAPDSAHLLVTSAESSSAWKTGDWREVATYQARAPSHAAVALSSDLRYVFIDQRLWRGDGTGPTTAVPLSGHNSRIIRAAFSPDGQMLATVSYDTTARLWEVERGKPLLVLRGHTSEVNDLGFSADGGFLYTAGSEGAVRFWEHRAPAGSVLRRPAADGPAGSVSPDPRRPYAYALGPDARAAVRTGGGEVPQLFDVESGRKLADLRDPAAGGAPACHAFSPDGELLALCGADRRVRLLDARTGELRLTLDAHDEGLSAVRFSPSGRLIATQGGGRVRLRETDTGRLVRAFEAEAVPAISPHDQLLILRTRLGVHVWEVGSGRQGQSLGGNGFSSVVAFSPDSRRVVSAGVAGVAIIREVGESTARPLRIEHNERVLAVEFSPDGELLATACGDGKVYVWNARTGEGLAAIGEGLTLPTRKPARAFSADGRFLITSDSTQTVSVWEARTGSPVMSWRPGRGELADAWFADGGAAVYVNLKAGAPQRVACELCIPDAELNALARARLALTRRTLTDVERRRYLGPVGPGPAPAAGPAATPGRGPRD